jgi:hypothetical protein
MKSIKLACSHIKFKNDKGAKARTILSDGAGL